MLREDGWIDLVSNARLGVEYPSLREDVIQLLTAILAMNNQTIGIVEARV